MQFESYIVHIVSKDFRLDGDDTFSDLMGGGEVPPGLPVSFHTADFKETVETLVMKLCFEAGAAPIRFQKKA